MPILIFFSPAAQKIHKKKKKSPKIREQRSKRKDPSRRITRRETEEFTHRDWISERDAEERESVYERDAEELVGVSAADIKTRKKKYTLET